MSAPREPAPDKIMQYLTGGLAAAIVGSAARHGVFDALDGGGDRAEGVVNKTGISLRGAQALLDGLTGLGLISYAGGLYRNSPEASVFLIKGKPGYLGGIAEVMTEELAMLARLPGAVKTGVPASNTADKADNEFWHVLVPAMATLSIPVAKLALERLGVATAGPISWLDVGGGSGVWSAVWLGANKQATGFQLDWPVVNQIATKFVGSFGVANRFQTIDGDFHAIDFGSGKYDFAIYGQIAHQETPAENVEIFRKFRRALKSGGTLVINDFILSDDRTGHPFAMLFTSQMLLVTKGGFTWRQSDYRQWLGDAGFSSVEIVPTPTPSTLIFAS